MAVFTISTQALKCAQNIQEKISQWIKARTGYHLELKIGLSAGSPVTERDEFFGETTQLAERLSQIAPRNMILISPLVRELSKDSQYFKSPYIKTISLFDQNFINRLLEVLEGRLNDPKYNVGTLSNELGISRPQLYRKIMSLSGLSPSDFIKEVRLKKVIKLFKNQYGNISESSYAVGFNDPSYFSKCFQRKFNIAPSRYCQLISGELLYSNQNTKESKESI